MGWTLLFAYLKPRCAWSNLTAQCGAYKWLLIG
jgi:hypothetical protein